MAIIGGKSTYRDTVKSLERGEQTAPTGAPTAAPVKRPTNQLATNVLADGAITSFDPDKRGGGGRAAAAGAPRTALEAQNLRMAIEMTNKEAEDGMTAADAVPVADVPEPEIVEAPEVEVTEPVEPEPLTAAERIQAVNDELDRQTSAIKDEAISNTAMQGDIAVLQAQAKKDLAEIAAEEKIRKAAKAKFGEQYSEDKLRAKITSVRDIAEKQGVDLNVAEAMYEKQVAAKSKLDPVDKETYDTIISAYNSPDFVEGDAFSVAIAAYEQDGVDADDMDKAHAAVASRFGKNFADEMEDKYLIEDRKIDKAIVENNRKLIDARKIGGTIAEGKAGARVANSYLQTIMGIDESLVPGAINQILMSDATDDAKKQAAAFAQDFYSEVETGVDVKKKEDDYEDVTIGGRRIRVYDDESREAVVMYEAPEEADPYTDKTIGGRVVRFYDDGSPAEVIYESPDEKERTYLTKEEYAGGAGSEEQRRAFEQGTLALAGLTSKADEAGDAAAAGLDSEFVEMQQELAGDINARLGNLSEFQTQQLNADLALLMDGSLSKASAEEKQAQLSALGFADLTELAIRRGSRSGTKRSSTQLQAMGLPRAMPSFMQDLVVEARENAGMGNETFQAASRKDKAGLATRLETYGDLQLIGAIKSGDLSSLSERQIKELTDAFGISEGERVKTGALKSLWVRGNEFVGTQKDKEVLLDILSSKYTVDRIKEISGLAVSDSERAALQEVLPNIDKFDTRFEFATSDAIRDMDDTLIPELRNYGFFDTEEAFSGINKQKSGDFKNLTKSLQNMSTVELLARDKITDFIFPGQEEEQGATENEIITQEEIEFMDSLDPTDTYWDSVPTEQLEAYLGQQTRDTEPTQAEPQATTEPNKELETHEAAAMVPPKPIEEAPATAQEYIEQKEGFREEAYQDSAGVWTIGYGATRVNGVPVKEGDTIDKTKAIESISGEINRIEKKVDATFGNSLNEYQKIALTSFMYNLGDNIFDQPEAQMLKEAIKEGDVDTIREQWVQYINAGGTPLVGLQNRRKDELALFLTSLA